MSFERQKTCTKICKYIFKAILVLLFWKLQNIDHLKKVAAVTDELRVIRLTEPLEELSIINESESDVPNEDIDKSKNKLY